MSTIPPPLGQWLNHQLKRPYQQPLLRFPRLLLSRRSPRSLQNLGLAIWSAESICLSSIEDEEVKVLPAGVMIVAAEVLIEDARNKHPLVRRPRPRHPARPFPGFKRLRTHR